MNDDRWVNRRLAALEDSGQWQPDVTRAQVRLQTLDRRAKIKRRCAMALAAVSLLGLVTLTQPGACANPLGCSQNSPKPAVPPPAAAPITCEIYSDFECPSCAAFFRDTLPLLIMDYVQKGKVRLVHRDFPLPQHPYAMLAARYVNAAGKAGQYDVAAAQLFKTQDIWSQNGRIAVQLAAVLSPGVMQEVSRIVEKGPPASDSITEDQKMAVLDGVHQTPTLVIVWKGTRRVIAPIPGYPLLKSYLDTLR